MSGVQNWIESEGVPARREVQQQIPEHGVWEALSYNTQLAQNLPPSQTNKRSNQSIYSFEHYPGETSVMRFIYIGKTSEVQKRHHHPSKPHCQAAAPHWEASQDQCAVFTQGDAQ